MASPRPSSDLNVTPLIDVLLVLLVIFLSSQPLTQQGLDADIPQEVQPQEVPLVPLGQIVLEVGPTKALRINAEPIAAPDMAARLRVLFADRHDKTLFVIGDGGLRYRDIADVIDVATGAGVEKIGIVTEAMRRR